MSGPVDVFAPDYEPPKSGAPAEKDGPVDVFAEGYKPPESSGIIRRAIGDTALAAGQGIIGLGQSVYGLADAATRGALDRGAKAVTEAVSPGNGATITEGLAKASNKLGEWMSPEGQALTGAVHREAQSYGEAGKELLSGAGEAGRVAGQIGGEAIGAIVGAAKNPASIPLVIAQSLPSMYPPAKAVGVITGRVAEAAGRKAFAEAVHVVGKREATALAEKAAAEAAQKFATGAKGIATASVAEGITAGAQNAQQAKAEVLAMPESKLGEFQPYRELIAAGLSSDEARARLANDVADRTLLASGALSTLAGPLSGAFEARLGARLFGGKAASGVGSPAGIGGVVKSAAAEGGQELVQSGGEQFGQNWGMRALNPNQSLVEGVGEQAGIGAVAGVGMGAGGNIISRPAAEGPAPGTPGAPPSTEPSGPTLALPAPGQTPIPMGAGQTVNVSPDRASEDAAVRRAEARNAARDAYEAEQANLAAQHAWRAANPISTAAGLLPAPGQTVAPVAPTPLGPDEAPFQLTLQHAEQNAADHAAAVYAARAAVEAERARFAAQGPLSAAAAHAVTTGVTAQATQQSQELASDATSQPQAAIPKPISEQERAQSVRLAEQLAQARPMALADAQVRAAAAAGQQALTVVPMPGNAGYTVVASDDLSVRQQEALRGLQRPSDAPVSEQATRMPLASPGAAEARAARLAMETGREWEVVPHPMARDKFAVRPKQAEQLATQPATSTQRGQPASAVQQPAVFTNREQPHGVNDAVQEQGAAGVLQREPGQAGVPGGERGRVEPSIQGQEVAGQGAAPGQRQGEGVSSYPANAAGQGDGAPADGQSVAQATAQVNQEAIPAAPAETPYAQITRLVADAATSPTNDRDHPTSKQSLAGNYKKVRIPPALVGGLPVTVENPAGSIRVAPDGSWASAMPHHYGYIRRTEGNDGDRVDIAIGPGSGVFVVNQLDPKTGAFDEHKVMYGFDTQEAAEAAYRAAYPADWKGFGSIVPTTVDELKAWLAQGRRTEPFGSTQAGATQTKRRDEGSMASEGQGIASYGLRPTTSLDYAARPVTSADPASVPHAKHLFGDPAARVVDIDGGAKATPEEKRAYAAIIADAQRLGLPDVALDGLRPLATIGGVGSGSYWYETQTIALSRQDLRAAAAGNKWWGIANIGKFIHEVMHHISGTDRGITFVEDAPALSIGRNRRGDRVARGQVIAEAKERYDNGPEELRRFLAYPFEQWFDKTLSIQHTVVLQDEVFAQLGRLYYTNPRLLRLEMPKAFALMEEIHNAIARTKSIAEARDAVRATLQRVPAYGGLRAAGSGANANDRGGAAVGQAGRGVGGQAVREPNRPADDARGDRERGRPDQVTHSELLGDGRDFTAFFADATRGGRKPNTGRAYTPVIDISGASEFSREYAKHRGNFDDHIATSIPGFREVQQAVGNAIAKTYAGGGRVLDVGASEGSFIKAISAVTGGKVKTVGLDPNPAMAQFFAEHSTVPGSSYAMAAFGAQDDAGSKAWTEDDGTEIKYFNPIGTFDVVHEAMTFQFISNARGPQVARVKELLSPNGVALFEEKFIPPPAEFDANEAKKDAYKAQYYSQDELDRKKKDVLERGQEAADAAEKEKEAKFVGMHKLMVSPAAFERTLSDNFKHVVQYWDSGNFKGYAASDDANALHALVRQMGDLNSEYATVQTPRQVADAVRGRQRELNVREPGATSVMVNIGLNTNDGKGITKAQAMRALKQAGVKVLADEVRQSNTEQTLVATLDRALTPEEAHQISVDLKQEAIAQRIGDEGELYGPQADNWKPFNKKFFLEHTKEAQGAAMLKAADAYLNRVAGSALTEQERAVLKAGVPRVAMKRAQRFAALFDLLPSTKQYVHAALAGKAARGWYEKSRRAGEAMYGRDYPRFAALMAALSPQTDVPTNFYNAAQVWAAWSRRGRPTDAATIVAILNDNLITPDGKKAGAEVMSAYRFNVIRALRHPTGDVQLSGPKVESFRQNLIGNLNEVTNDRHNAAFSGIMQELLGGDTVKPPESDLSKAFGIKSPGYISLSVRYRQAARELTKLTGETWTPAEVQETSWSFWRTLYNLTTAEGETRSALQIIRDGDLTHELIAETPTLGQYFDTARFRHITRGEAQASDGDAVAAGRISAAERGVAREAGPVAETPAVVRIARRLDRLIAERRAAAEAKAEDKRFADTNRELALYGNEIADELGEAYAAESVRVGRPGALAVKEPLWYSALSRAIEKAPFSKDGTMPAGQLRMWLAANASKFSVKKDEVEWSSINDWLATRDGKVSRDDVTNFLDQNGVKVEETLLGERALPPGFKLSGDQLDGYTIAGNGAEGFGDTIEEAATNLVDRLEALARQWQKNGDEAKASRYFTRAEGITEWSESIAGYGTGKETKFSSYVLPGGKNYRELLLTLPTKPEDRGNYELPADHTVYKPDPNNYPYKWRHVDGDGNQIGPDFGVLPNTVAAAVRFAADRLHGGDRPNQQGGAFRSSHFDQPNILAHVRFNERTDAEGKRVLFIEEIQSDWAQKGRKSGFGQKSLDAELKELLDLEERMRTGRPLPDDGGPTLGERITELRERISGAATPPAPFVGKTEAWVALALKRMIRYAVDNGFDAVAWTTGEQQAERYDLSKPVRRIYLTNPVFDGDGNKFLRGHLSASATTGNEIINREVAAAELPEIIGKDAADRIVNNPTRKEGHTKQTHVLEGDDIKVGGEGMRAFYDKIVPNVANDALKKLGGGRVGMIDLTPVKIAPSNEQLIRSSQWIEQGTPQDGGPMTGVQPGFYIDDTARGEAMRPQALFVKDGGESAPANMEAAPLGGRVGRARELHVSSGAVRSQVVNAASDLLTTSRSFNLWERTVGTQYHKAHKASADPLFKRVYDGVQRFMNDASQLMMDASELAPDILPRLDKLRDIFRPGPSRADMKAVSSAVFDGTLNDVVYSDSELQARGMTDRQIGLYRQARAAIDKSLTDTATSEAILQARDLLPASVLEQARVSGNPWVVVDALANIQQKTQVQQQVYDQLRKRVAKVEDMKRKGYAPLQRFGRYTVTVQNSNGSTALFTLHESEREANAFARAVSEQLQPGQGVSQGVLSQDAWKVFRGISPDTLEIFADALGASEKELMQEYLKLAVNNRSVLKRMIQRKKIPGFQDDIQRTLAQFITSNSRAASRNYHWGDILKNTQLIPKERGDVKDEAIRLAQYVQEPGEEAGALRGLLFVQFLGGSVASAITNATQPIMMTFPWLAQYGGAIKAAARLAEAGAVAAGKAPAEPALRADLARATKEGIVDPHEVAGLYAESIRNFGAKPAVRRGLKVWGSLFSLAEAFNRKITFVAAYRTAVEESIQDPYAFAVKAIAETQGVYNRGNRPNWARGAVGATLFTFKQYSIAYMEFLARLPRKEQALALAVLVLAAGIQGLPGADDLEDVIDTIAESLGYSFNSKKHLREWAAAKLGNEAWANFAVHGFSGIPGVPIDMQARLGLQNLIPGTGLLKRSETNKGRDVLEFFGPAGSQIKSTVDAFTALQAGDQGAVARSLVPLAVRNAMKAVDMWQTGFYRDERGNRVIDVSAYEAALKAAGFQPRRVAEQSRVVQDAQQDINLHRDVEARLVGKMARSIVEHDPDAMQQARAELMEWNRRNPGSIVQITPQQVRQRAIKMMQTREVRFIKSAPRELRGHIAEELRG